MKSRIILASVVAALVALPVLAMKPAVESGLQPGETIIPFHPDHISGPLAGTSNCFPCTYGNRPAAQAWVHGEDMKVVGKLIHELQESMDNNKDKEFKAMMVMVLDNEGQKAKAKEQLKDTIEKSGGKDVAVALVTKDHEAVKQYKINLSPDVKNTVIFYKNRKIVNNLVNLKLNTEGCSGLCEHVAALLK